MTSLRSVGTAIILVPAGLAAFTLIPCPQHHPQPVSSPTTGAVAPSPLPPPPELSSRAPEPTDSSGTMITVAGKTARPASISIAALTTAIT